MTEETPMIDKLAEEETEAHTPGWVERAYQEKTELYDRINRLTAYLGNPENVNKLDHVVIGQLNVQLRAMEAYYVALQNRLEYYYMPPTGV